MPVGIYERPPYFLLLLYCEVSLLFSTKTYKTVTVSSYIMDLIEMVGEKQQYERRLRRKSTRQEEDIAVNLFTNKTASQAA